MKILRKESDIPDGAQRPIRDFGYHLATCQGFVKSRREGMLIAMTKADMWCPEAVVGYGLAQPPEYFLEGRQCFPQSFESLETGSIWAREFPRLEYGECIGVMSAPLTTANFEPDVVMVYCDSAQLGMLLLAAAHKTGHELKCTVSAKGACVYSVVLPMQTGNYQVSVPCPGDRKFAGAQDNEIIFSFPFAKIEALLKSLRYLEQWDYRLPLKHVVHPEYELAENYVVAGKLMGMDWLK